MTVGGFQILVSQADAATTIAADSSQTFPDQSANDPGPLLDDGDKRSLRILAKLSASAGYQINLVHELTDRKGETVSKHVVRQFTPAENQSGDDASPVFEVEGPHFKNGCYLEVADANSTGFDVQELAVEWETSP